MKSPLGRFIEAVASGKNPDEALTTAEANNARTLVGVALGVMVGVATVVATAAMAGALLVQGIAPEPEVRPEGDKPSTTV